jgi:hypothetical protein
MAVQAEVRYADDIYADELNEAGSKCLECGEVGWSPGYRADRAAAAECSYCSYRRRPAPALVEAFDAGVRELERQSVNAARRNKPTMWAYYADQAETLRALSIYRADVDRLEQALRDLTTVALAVSPVLSPLAAARAWSRGVHARKILRAGGLRAPDPSLSWLRARATIAESKRLERELGAVVDRATRQVEALELSCPNCGDGTRAQCALCSEFGPHEIPCYHGDTPAGLAAVERAIASAAA